MKAIRKSAPAEVLAMAHDQHHIVAASAGTGKTFVIEHRVVDLIVRGVARIDQILVVTFTEKATAELRLRVRAKLESLLAADRDDSPSEPGWLIDEQARRRLESALLAFDRAPIFTIHGFCHRIAAEGGFARGRAMHPVQVSAAAVFAETFAELVRTELALDERIAPLLAAWFRTDNTASKLRSHLYACRERGGVIEPVLDGEALARAVERANAALAGDPLRGLDVHHATKRAMERALPDLLAAVAAASEADTPEAALVALEPGRAALKKFAVKASPGGPALLSILAELAAVAIDLDAALTGAILERLERALRDGKAQRGQIDFGDMLAHVASALEGDDGLALAASLRERFPFALIDEFQDTSELQWQIFRLIYTAAGAARITVVGDPKQAIYAFRGADLDTYQRACDELRAAGAAEHVLATNYRSSPRLLEALHVLTAAEPPPAFFEHTAAGAPLRPGRNFHLTDNGVEAAPVVIAELTGEERISGAELARAIGDFFADEIARLLSDAGKLAIAGEGEPRPIGARDIMVLTRSRADSHAISAALSRRGVPSGAMHNEDIFTTREAREILDLLRGVGSPRTRVARSRAPATRYFDPPIATVATAASDPDQVDAIATLHRWRARAQWGNLEALLPEIVNESRIVLRELAQGRGQRTISNVEHLIELLVTDFVRSRCTLAELTERLESKIGQAAANELTEETPVRTLADEDVVRVLTIHAAKGLEAPIVFVFGGYGRRYGERIHTYHAASGERRLHIGTPPEEIADRVSAERDGEDERLLYVAITRAKARLYLAHISESTYKVSGPYANLNRRLAHAVGERSYLFAVRDPAEPVRAGAADASLRSEEPTPDLEVPSLPREFDAIREDRGGVAITSYSRLKRSVEASSEKFGNDAPGVDGSLGRLGGREVGVLVHWILERVDLAAVAHVTSAEELGAEPETARLIERAMRAFALESRYRDAIVLLTLAGLLTPLTIGSGKDERTIGCFRDCPRNAREVEFTFPIERDREVRGYVTGFLDVVLEAGGKLYVVDWKSDALPSYQPAALADHVGAAYQTQLELYSLALEQTLASNRSQMEFGGVIYCFLRAGSCYGVEASVADRAAFRARLLAMESSWRA